MQKYQRVIILAGLIVLVGVGIWAFLTYFEGENPEIVLSKDIGAIGQRTVFDITCTDRKSGIRSASVSILQNGKTTAVASVDLPARGKTRETLSIDLRPEDLKLHDGAATVVITVIDYSLRKNTGSTTIEAVIDTAPPWISPASARHYINPGGTCVVAYTLSEAVVLTGVKVNDHFSPSSVDSTGSTSRYISYFAIPI
ncbi:MAG: hypothetical protein QME27_07735, partial [Syntrophaceae bacterium]|nr:hypothetical protein [Syntrophaceae bacterium]